jgi:hypothetical protein
MKTGGVAPEADGEGYENSLKKAIGPHASPPGSTP